MGLLRGLHYVCTVAHIWRQPHYRPKSHLLDSAQTQMRTSPCPMKSASQTADMVKSCWHSKTATEGTARQLEKGQESRLKGPECRSPSQALHLCPSSCSTFLATQRQDNLWLWHTHCPAPVKELFNHHSE